MPNPQAQLVKVAEAVAAEMRNQTFTLNADVERKYIADLKLKDAGTLRIDVQAGDMESDVATRADTEYDCEVGILIRKRFTDAEEDADSGEIETHEIDRLILLVEEIHEFFIQRELAAYSEAVWIGVAFQPVWVPAHLREWGQFTGVVTVTFKVVI